MDFKRVPTVHATLSQNHGNAYEFMIANVLVSRLQAVVICDSWSDGIYHYCSNSGIYYYHSHGITI